MVYNPELMSESNWAYLASMEVVKDITEDVNLFGAHGLSTTNLFSSHLDRKQTSLQSSNKAGSRGPA